MAFDDKTRAQLSRFVTEARELLASEFIEKFQRLYGISPSGEIAPIENLPDLDDTQRATAQLLRERLAHLAAANPTDRNASATAVARLTREQAFTILNRLAAVRMAEKRGLIVGSVGRAYESDGFRVYCQVAGSALGEAYHRYRRYLFCLFDELAVDLGVLFDRRSPSGLLFPRESCLLKLLEKLNAPDLETLWAEDETIGWIYQYWNDPTERKKMREESSAPRNSRELAVRNQFFTPRYVVEFLTDNTLGRIWYEMTQGATKLKEQCRYLVRRPTEIFLKPGEAAPASDPGSSRGNEAQTSSANADQSLVTSAATKSTSAANASPSPPSEGGEGRGEVGAALSQEDLLKQPVHIPHRPLKDPRTILMLDPACGSMHFGLYAFDLFEVIYAEAWDLEEVGTAVLCRPPGLKSLHETYPDQQAFLRDVPKLIIEHNIHGIDIDPRCAQIAGLSLWLRAQRAWKDQGIPAVDRPRITRSNIVCAEPMPGEKELLREFVDTEFPERERGVFLRLLETIFDKMQLAGEAGSLLKIEEEIRSAIEEAKQAWEQLQNRPAELFSTSELNAGSKQQELAADLRPLTSDFWTSAESRLLAALRDYAEQAENGGGFQRRLFAEDAARGFAFIDVCRKRYDVVEMNPPFGVATPPVFAQLKMKMPSTYTELYASFVDQGLAMTNAKGRVGAITSRAFLYISRLETFRQNRLQSRIDTLLDLAGNVMDDAFVEACAYTICAGTELLELTAFDGRKCEKREHLHEGIRQFKSSNDFGVHVVPWRQLHALPSNKFLYYLPSEICSLLDSKTVFEPDIGTIRQGMGTFDDFRFVHLLWEVPPDGVGKGKYWEPLAKGGPFAKYYGQIHLAVNWWKDGGELCEVNRSRNGQTAQVRQASDYWRLGGCTYSKRSVKGFSARALPKGCIMAGKGPAVITQSANSELFFLGWLNSRLITGLIELQANASEFNTGILKALPWIQPDKALHGAIEALAHESAISTRALSRYDEADQYFVFSPYVRLGLSEQIEFANTEQARLIATVADNESRITCSIDELYNVDSTALGEHEVEGDADEDDDAEPSVTEDLELAYTAHLVAASLGVAFGRWDIRYATGEQAAPELPDPFAPLPVCPPGQLQNAQGLPACPEDVPATYPVRIPWDGILVDDPGHPLDIESRVRQIIEIIWSRSSRGNEAQTSPPTDHRSPITDHSASAESIEAEACQILGVDSLRDYFRKPSGFFADHLKRYSKSRRQAPIYWPLSTTSGSYTVWIYYHRLNEQTLHKVLADFVDPKIKSVERDITSLRERPGGAGSQVGELQEFLDELTAFRAEIERIVKLPWVPNLNDGVLITACPLWKLFRLPKWRKDLEACWKELERGDYDWAHLAYTIRPDQVREKCKTDRSLAIAHGLEALCTVQAPVKKAKKNKKDKPEGQQPDLPED